MGSPSMKPETARKSIEENKRWLSELAGRLGLKACAFEKLGLTNAERKELHYVGLHEGKGKNPKGIILEERFFLAEDADGKPVKVLIGVGSNKFKAEIFASSEDRSAANHDFSRSELVHNLKHALGKNVE